MPRLNKGGLLAARSKMIKDLLFTFCRDMFNHSTVQLFSTFLAISSMFFLLSCAPSGNFNNAAERGGHVWNIRLTQTGIGEVKVEWSAMNHPKVTGYVVCRGIDGEYFVLQSLGYKPRVNAEWPPWERVYKQ